MLKQVELPGTEYSQMHKGTKGEDDASENVGGRGERKICLEKALEVNSRRKCWMGCGGDSS